LLRDKGTIMLLTEQGQQAFSPYMIIALSWLSVTS
jgi:hypothetical protein